MFAKKMNLSTRVFISAICALALMLSMLSPFVGVVSAAPSLPANYNLTPVVNGLDYPTNTAWLPDGTMLIAEKSGVVRAFKDGVLQAQPFIDISGSTNDYWDRGLLGLAVDPAYSTNHYVYLIRTVENGIGGYSGTKMGQLVRVTINPATNQMVGGSLVALVGKETAASCDDLAVTADCMPSDSPSHSVGDVIFAPDGTLFITTGDGASFTEVDPRALRAQNLDSLAGKVLHIDRNGKGLPTNPFYNGNSSANRSKVWAYGLRNPWRLTLKPGTSMPYVVDVGWDDWEEVNVASSGANLGWPCYEGNGQQGLGYGELSGCQQLYTRVDNGQATVKAPLTAWDHSGGSAAAVGGTFVTSDLYPTSLKGRYLFGDYAFAFARTLTTGANHALTGGPTAFAQNMPGQVNIEQGPDGYVYVVSIADETNAPGTGKIYRLDYDGTPPPPPPPADCAADEFLAEYFNDQTPGSEPALTRCEPTALDHNWQSGSPGAGVNDEQFSARWTGNFNFDAGTYRFDAWADDGVRVYLDGQLALNGWFDQPYTHYEDSVNVTAGQHTVVVEYYDAFEAAAVKVNWTQTSGGTPTSCPDGQFKAEYFNALTPSGTAALTDCEAAPINHNWQSGSPGAGVNDEQFSARYTGRFDFQTGQYKFMAAADDGVRIFVDGNQVLNGWFDQPVTAYESFADLTAGAHTVTIEYYDKLEAAVLSASWAKTGGGNTAPQATIATPGAVSSAAIGSTVHFSGSATDAEDGTLPGSSLNWNAVVRHCNEGHCHSHFLQQFTGTSGSFVYPDHGEEEYYVELNLVATDSQGATSTVKTVRIDPDRPPATCPSDWYVAEFFNNTTLSGLPVATACLETVDYDWAYDSPLANVDADFFSARFTTTKSFAADTYQFSVTGDDGVRLFIDDQLFINEWQDQPATTYTQNRVLTGGLHTLKLEFYEATEAAVVSFDWAAL